MPTNSPYRSLADFIAALKQRPEAISWGGGSAGGSDQILAGLVAEAVGVPAHRINYVAFSGGGESLSAIIGGQVSVGVNGLAEFAPHIEAGTIRALAISSADRLPGLDVPTLREQGVNVEFENWRSVVAPPGISRDQRNRLTSLVGQMVQSAEWREALARYRWLDRYLSGPAFDRFVAAEEARVQAILRRFGTGRDDAGTLASAGPYPLLILAGLLMTGVAAVVHDADGSLRRTQTSTATSVVAGRSERGSPGVATDCASGGGHRLERPAGGIGRVPHRVHGPLLVHGTCLRRASSGPRRGVRAGDFARRVRAVRPRPPAPAAVRVARRLAVASCCDGARGFQCPMPNAQWPMPRLTDKMPNTEIKRRDSIQASAETGSVLQRWALCIGHWAL